MVLREGVKAVLKRIPEVELAAEASDGLELLALLEKQSADLLIVDLGMPNLGGIEVINRLQKMKQSPAILVLSAREDEIAVRETMRAGAQGYLPKSSASDELEAAVKALLKGLTYISPAVAGGLLALKNEGEGADNSPLAGLSAREREVMKLLSEGRPNREIAKLLHISPRTIDSHRANILKKLGISSNAELSQIALKYGLIE